MKAAALKLAAMGIHVFPLVANGKTPATLHGYQDASQDAKRVAEMWKHRPGANIGIATGASGLVVIDVDAKHDVDGWDSLTAAMDKLGELPGPTRMASTPNGGGHFISGRLRALRSVTRQASLGPVSMFVPEADTLLPRRVSSTAKRIAGTSLSCEGAADAWAKAMAVPIRKAPEGRLPSAQHTNAAPGATASLPTSEPAKISVTRRSAGVTKRFSVTARAWAG